MNTEDKLNSIKLSTDFGNCSDVYKWSEITRNQQKLLLAIKLLFTEIKKNLKSNEKYKN